ncbi:oligosaccharide flippase family protein [Agarivorans aestuarii]|uniref:oligosaccharide flippase family protein n=1 Tax=Agarivorans aestuarii TaxID=1563703 RepID=UPI001C826C83|nr:oligosaccharide flippase family protein [Agarivorans aestuarii]
MLRSSFKTFFAGFFSRGGHLIFSSSLCGKVIGFLVSLIVVRLLTIEDYGLLTLYKNIFVILTPIVGLGLNHAILYYGAVEGDQKELFVKCVITSFLTLPITYLISFYIIALVQGSPSNTHLLNVAFGYCFLFFIVNCYGNYKRSCGENKAYALLSIAFPILSLLLIPVVLVFEPTVNGYYWGQIYAGAITIVLSIKLFENKKTLTLDISLSNVIAQKKHIQYGVYVSLGALASQLILVSDVFMLGIMDIALEEIAVYGVCSLIFTNLLFIPGVIMTSDFVHLAKLSKSETISYYKGYLLSVTPILVFSILAIAFFSEEMLTFLFGYDSQSGSVSLKVLTIALASSYLLRVPIGNILNAKGYATVNVIVSIVFGIGNLALNYYLIPKLGIVGASISTSAVILFSSLVSFFVLMRKLK